jgi:hypothetical protein
LEFKKSWELYPEKFTVEYNELISDTLPVIQNLTEYVGIKKSKEEIQSVLKKINKMKPGKINKNVGKVGRGKLLLPQNVLDYIEEIESCWEKYLPKGKAEWFLDRSV